MSYCNFRNCILFCLFIIQPAFGLDYEQCDWRNEASSPFSNTNHALIDLISLLPSLAPDSLDISNKCFLASSQKTSASGSREKFINCEKRNDGTWMKTNLKVIKCIEEDKTQNCEEKYIYPRRPCLDEDYVMTTNAIFNTLAKCFDLPSKELFVLFNHESGFVSNIRSHTGARCYGQMTVGGIKTVNNKIKQNSSIYKNFIKKCPSYKDSLIISSAVTRKDIRQTDCELTKNPFSCFFYSMFFVKWLKTEIHSLMEQSIKKKSEFHWIEEELGLHLPIKLNEIVVVSDHRTGNIKRYLFQNEEEIQKNKNRNLIKSYMELKENSKIKITKIPMFRNDEQDEIEWLLTYWSYNGGMKVASKNFIKYIKEFKHGLSLPCSTSSEFFCFTRNKLLYDFKNKEYGLKLTKHFIEDFSYYLSRNYKHHKNRSEVASFVFNLQESMKPIFQEEGCKI